MCIKSGLDDKVYVGQGGVFKNSGSSTATRKLNIWTNGVVTLDDGSFGMSGATYPLINYGGIVQGAGSVKGSFQNAGGTIRPGGTNGIGALSFEGTFRNSLDDESAPGTVEIALAGGAGGEYGRLVVSSTLTCAGTLDVVFLNGYVPAERKTFDIMNGNPIAGTFAAVNLPDVPGGIRITDDLYTTGEIEFIPPASGTAILIR
jgi:hypothetical protein